MSVLEWKKEETVAVITMTTSENRHNPEFCRDMMTALDEIQADTSIYSVVIMANDEKNWSQGIDLVWLSGRMKEGDLSAIKGFLYGINEVFRRILLYPLPVIACLTGHTVANGLILSCACDFRFMRADQGFFFFPEIDIGIPLLPGMAAFLKKAIPYYKFNEMILTGKRYFAREMEEHHVIHKACDNLEELLNETMAFAKTFTKNRGTFGEMKRRLHKAIIDEIDQEDPKYIEPLRIMVKD
jgi:enoyl-CoA hydratase/carnithine racemase